MDLQEALNQYKEVQAFPIYLDGSALIHYNSFAADTKADFELLKADFTNHYNSEMVSQIKTLVSQVDGRLEQFHQRTRKINSTVIYRTK